MAVPDAAVQALLDAGIAAAADQAVAGAQAAFQAALNIHAQNHAALPVLSRSEPVTFSGRVGENVDNWLLTFRRFVRAHAIPDQRALSLLPTYLRGAALNFFNRTETTHQGGQQALTFDDWAQLLRNEYPPTRDAALKEVELMHRAQKSTESASEFAAVIRELVKSAYPTLDAQQQELVAKGAFLRGLSPVIKRFTMAGAEPATLDEAVQRACQQEVQEQLSNSSAISNDFSFNLPIIADVQKLTHAVNTLTQQFHQTHLSKPISSSDYNRQAMGGPSFLQRPRGRGGYSQQQQQKTNFSNNNRFSNKPEYNTQGVVRCWNCGKLGHHKAACRLRQRSTTFTNLTNNTHITGPPTNEGRRRSDQFVANTRAKNVSNVQSAGGQGLRS